MITAAGVGSYLREERQICLACQQVYSLSRNNCCLF